MSKTWKLIKLESQDRYKRLFSQDSCTSGMKAGYVILKPGENIGEHTTGEREEALVILKGTGEAILGGEELIEISENTSLYIPPKTQHDIKNTGGTSLEYVFITSKADVF